MIGRLPISLPGLQGAYEGREESEGEGGEGRGGRGGEGGEGKSGLLLVIASLPGNTYVIQEQIIYS